MYCERSDSFVLVDSGLGLSSYRYGELAVSGGEVGGPGGGQAAASGRRVVADWSLVVGEGGVRELAVVESGERDQPATILLTTRHALTALTDTGATLWTKRLDFSPRGLLCLPGQAEGRVVSLVPSDTGSLHFYHNTALRWAARLPLAPVCLGRGRFWCGETSTSRPGLLVLLAEDGELVVTYLGSDPTLYTAAPPDSREVNYEETDRELARLSTLIKQSQTAGRGPGGSGGPGLRAELSLSSQLELCRHPSAVLDTEPAVPMVGVTLSLDTPCPVTRVQLSLQVAPPLGLSSQSASLPSLSARHTFSLHAFLAQPGVVPSLGLTALVTFTTQDGAPHSLHTTATLPLSLVVKPCAPVKDADYKVTLSTNKPAVSLLELFPEFVLDSSMANAAGFQLYGGPTITVLSSKTSQRYRLQSEDLAAIWTITEVVKQRLEEKFRRGDGSTELECSYTSSLPIQEFFTEIDAHWAARQAVVQAEAVLAQRMSQFRAIQRRLLTRFKDKTPTPLTNLDLLLDGTQRQVVGSCEQCSGLSRAEQRAAARLSCVTRLLLLLARLTAGMDSEEADRLEAALSPVVHSAQEQVSSIVY